LWASGLDSPDEAERRHQTLEAALRKLQWIPENHRLRPGTDVEATSSILWDDWHDRRGGWSAHRFARGTHETMVLMLGVTEEGLYQGSSARWTNAARAQWEATFKSEAEWRSSVDLPDHPASSERRRLAQPRQRPISGK
jgi:hypothetical protein